MAVRLSQFANVSASRMLSIAGSLIDSTALKAKVPAPIKITESGIDIGIKGVLLKAELPIDTNPEGNSIWLNELRIKVSGPILITDSGISISYRL